MTPTDTIAALRTWAEQQPQEVREVAELLADQVETAEGSRAVRLLIAATVAKLEAVNGA